MKKSFLILLAFVLIQFNLPGQTEVARYFTENAFKQTSMHKFDIEIKIDPRIELLQTLMLLAGNPHTNNENLDYKMTILDRFNHIKNHASLATFRELVRKKFNSLDGPVFFFVRLNERFELRNDIDNRVYQDDIEIVRLLESIRSLVKEMDYISFFNEQTSFYNIATSTFAYHLSDFDEKTRMMHYYKKSNASNYHFCIILNLLGSGNFGPGHKSDKGEELYAIISPSASFGNLPVFDLNEIHYLVWHEFSHSFINPLIDQHYEELQKSERLFQPIATSMAAQAYPDWRVTLKEHLVRAVTCRLAENKYGNDFAELNYTSTEIGKKYIYLPIMLEELKRYEQDRALTLEMVVQGIATRLALMQDKEVSKLLQLVEKIRKPDVDVLPKIGEVGHRVLIIVPEAGLPAAKKSMTWPGLAMKKWKQDWYYFNIENTLTSHVIFNNQSGAQTQDLLNVGGTQFYDGEIGSWISPPKDIGYGHLEKENSVLVFFKPNKSWGDQAFVYAWQDDPSGDFNNFMQRYSKYFQDGQLISDQEAMTMDVSDHDLIIFGNFQNNAFLRTHYSEIPVKFTAKGMVADRNYEADDLVLITAWLHPTDKSRISELYISNKLENMVNMDWVERGGTNYHITRGVVSIKAGNYSRRMKIWRF